MSGLCEASIQDSIQLTAAGRNVRTKGESLRVRPGKIVAGEMLDRRIEIFDPLDAGPRSERGAIRLSV